ncbi:MAG: preprotein translocase subunit SecG [bacterium]
MEKITPILPWIQIGLSALLIGVILLQQNESGMSGNMSGGQIRTKRGVEKVIFMASIVIAVLFAISALLAVSTSTF